MFAKLERWIPSTLCEDRRGSGNGNRVRLYGLHKKREIRPLRDSKLWAGGVSMGSRVSV